jgi:hypothetical protein
VAASLYTEGEMFPDDRRQQCERLNLNWMEDKKSAQSVTFYRLSAFPSQQRHRLHHHGTRWRGVAYRTHPQQDWERTAYASGMYSIGEREAEVFYNRD